MIEIIRKEGYTQSVGLTGVVFVVLGVGFLPINKISSITFFLIGLLFQIMAICFLEANKKQFKKDERIIEC